MSVDFESFYKSMGFEEYPFATFSSESESVNARELYIRPQNHSVIMQLFTAKSSMVIYGERGIGKTALASDMFRFEKPNDLFVGINELKDLGESYTSNELYRSIIDRISEKFFIWLASRSTWAWKLSTEDRVRLSYYLQHHVRPASKALLTQAIVRLQNPLYKRAAIWLINKARGVINYGLNTASSLANDVVTRHFPAFPTDLSKYKEYLGELSISTDQSYDKDKRDFRSLETLCSIIKRVGVNRIAVKIDKLDEDPRFNNSAEDIADFIRTLACDNTLLLHPDLQIVLFLWSTPFNYVKDAVRTQKLNVQRLEWAIGELESALDKRLSVYSKNRIRSHRLIIDSASERFKDILEISNHNPRDLWHIMDECMKAQYRIDPSCKMVETEAMTSGIDNFVRTFNFYEYYPRKSNARANSLDIYSYIKHLSKLTGTTFTKDQFNREAGAGSSTNNYISAMENMGLIARTEEKSSAAVLYRIRDPKVVYAIEKKIEIQRES